MYPTAIGSEPQDPSLDSSAHWQRTMQGHAAANVMPLVASNRIGVEEGENYSMTFYGSSFIASHTGEKVAEADRTSETVLTADVRSRRGAPLPPGLGRLPRSAPRSVLPAPVARWTRLRPRELPHDLVFVDLETTGGNAAHHRITEIGIVRVAARRGGRGMEHARQPRVPHSLRTSRVSPASPTRWSARAPRFADIAAPGAREAQARPARASAPVFAAHNARFDYSFLRAEFRRAGAAFLRAGALHRQAVAPPLSRASAAQSRRGHGAARPRVQRAAPGARRCAGASAISGSTLCAAICPSRISPRPRTAAHGRGEAAAAAARGPGGRAARGSRASIVSRGAGDEILLFVGKSELPAQRHPRRISPMERSRRAAEHKLKDAVRRIEWDETAGELGALLRELEGSRTSSPATTAVRDPRAAACHAQACEASGAVQIARDRGARPRRARRVLRGVSLAEGCAQGAGRHRARRSSCASSCWASRRATGRASRISSAAARARASARSRSILHAVRVQMALASLKFKAWPFPGRVALRRARPMGGADSARSRSLELSRHRALRGGARRARRAAPLDCAFDPQVYRILVRYLANHPKLDWHDLEAQSARTSVTRSMCIDGCA